MVPWAFSQQKELTFEPLTIREGLSHNTVYCLAQDSAGFIWMGTRNGLCRYDGFKFNIYQPDGVSGHGIRGRRILSLWASPDSNLWVGFKDGGMQVFNQRKGVFRDLEVNVHPELNWQTISVQSIQGDGEGNMWVGTLGQGAALITPQGKVLKWLAAHGESERIGSDFVFGMTKTPDGSWWLATAGNSVSVYHPKTGEAGVWEMGKNGFPNIDSYAKTLYLESPDRLWLGVEGRGLFLINPGLRTLKAVPLVSPGGAAARLVTDIAPASGGGIWVTTDGNGLFKLNKEEVTFHQGFTEGGKGLNTLALYQWLQDREGNIWLGTFNGGVNVHLRFRPGFRYHEPQVAGDNLKGKSVLALAAGDDALWFGLDGGGLYRWKNGEKQPQKVGPGPGLTALSSDVITCIAPGQNGHWWVGTFAAGLNELDASGRLVRVYRHDPAIPGALSHNNVWTLLPEAGGGLWVGTLGGGLDYLAPGATGFVHYQTRAGDDRTLSEVQITALLQDTSGGMWVGTESRGLDYLSPDRQNIRHFRVGDGIKSNSILCLARAGQGQLWVGTEGGGLHLLDAQKGVLKVFAVATGFPSDVIYSIFTGNDEELWLSTGAGITRLDTQSGAFVSYTSGMQLEAGPFNPRAVVRDAYGTIWWGGVHGLNSLPPAEAPASGSLGPPRVYLNSLKLFNAEVQEGRYKGRRLLTGAIEHEEELRLRFSDNFFTLTFGALEFTAPERVRYAYRMLGFSPEWTETDARQREATFTNLDPGSYVFEVKAASSSGGWGPVKQLRVEVAPPFWRTWYFRTGLVLLAVLLALAYIRFLRRQQQRELKEQALAAEKEILHLKSTQLQSEVENKNARLNATLLHTTHKNQVLTQIRDQVVDFGKKLEGEDASKLRSLIRQIDSEVKEEDYWDQFRQNFDQVHQHFTATLLHLHPDLTPAEIRLCYLVRTRLSNPEIAAILNITLSGVEKGKYRLKKKLGMAKEDDLNQYLFDLGEETEKPSEASQE
jgi:ligand-binding sensor domain-containing protein/DNA-binding CsgD family transcriptional regulator